MTVFFLLKNCCFAMSETKSLDAKRVACLFLTLCILCSVFSEWISFIRNPLQLKTRPFFTNLLKSSCFFAVHFVSINCVVITIYETCTKFYVGKLASMQLFSLSLMHFNVPHDTCNPQTYIFVLKHVSWNYRVHSLYSTDSVLYTTT